MPKHCPQLVEKVCFFKKSACSQSLSPNPFPRERGYITGATAPRPCRGLRPCDPIFIIDRGFSTVWNPLFFKRRIFCLHRSSNALLAPSHYNLIALAGTANSASSPNPTPFILHIFEKFFKTLLTNCKSSDIIKPTKSIGF